MNIVAFITPNAEPKSPLDRKAEYINDQFARMERAEARASKAKTTASNAETTADNARVHIGRALIDAKETLRDEDPDRSFEAWCEAKVKRSMRDCYACMRLADVRARHGCMTLLTGAEGVIWDRRDDDQPQAAPADGGIMVHQQNKSVQIAIGLYRKMTVEDREEVKRAQEEIDHA
jgi:hypothetical protein